MEVSFPLSLQVYPEVKDSNQACLPPSSFITCSSDNTIRLWNTESSGVHGSTLHRNILSDVSLIPTPFLVSPSPRYNFCTLVSGTASSDLDLPTFIWLGSRSQGFDLPSIPLPLQLYYVESALSISADLFHQDLIKIIYVDGNTQALLDTELPGGDKADGSLMDPRVGIRSVCISPNGQHLASGDRMGTLR
jgi:WD40 repeat protein